MVCMETLYKRKTLIILESAMQAVDQPSDGIDGREVDKDVVAPLPIMALVHSCHAVLFY